MKYDWNTVGGDGQTSLFAASLFANVDFKKLDEIRSVLDFGCATGDSAPYISIFLPQAKIYLYDVSEKGLNKAISKYSRFVDVEKYSHQTIDFVYCSNVIEHIEKPGEFVGRLVDISNKYICIQAPWCETWPNGDLITPQKPFGEHVWCNCSDPPLQDCQQTCDTISI